jgi:membrane-associated phospholipid phosphatase
MTRAAVFDERAGHEYRIATRLHSWSPPAVAAAAAFLGYVVLALLLVGIGLILTKLLIPGPVGTWDNSVNRWFVDNRTSTGNTLTDYASILAGTGTVLTIAGAAAVILAIRRLWYEIGFLLIMFFIEFSVFLTTVTLIDRPRPTVPKLDGVPATSSFPSGHVAAAIVLYVGLAILISSQTRHTVIRVLVWAIALTFVVGVGISRVYRGLHHPTDVFAGVILGTGALLFAIMAMRSADAASRARAEKTIDTPTLPQPTEVGS